MDAIFMNSENSETSKPYVVILPLLIKQIWEEVKNVLLYQILVFITHGKT